MNTNITILITIILFSGCTSLEPTFTAEVKHELADNHFDAAWKILPDSIANLPLPVQRYLQTCGYLGNPAMENARIEWKTANIKQSADGRWTPLECVQYNFVDNPCRIVYLNAALWGIVPFDGRDKYQHDTGNMHIRVMNMIEVENASGKEMDQSSLVTILAEAPMVPSALLQNYIQWKSIDSLTAEATLIYNGYTVRGTFYFNTEGEYIRFETRDRYHSKNGVHTNYPWIINASEYKNFDGYRQASMITAAWITENGLYEYWRGEIGSVRYNVRE